MMKLSKFFDLIKHPFYPTPQQNQATKDAMRALFHSAVENASEYSIVYGKFNRERNFVIVKTMTSFSYAIGFHQSQSALAILPIDIDLEACGDPMYFTKENTTKAKWSFMYQAYQVANKDGDKASFVVPSSVFNITRIVDYDVPIVQKEEAIQFQTFFQQHFGS